MATRSLLIAGACLLAQLAIAQSVLSRSFMLGPTFGVNKTSYNNDARYMGWPSLNAPIGMFGGIDASYQVNRWLIGTKLLYQKQTYQATYPPPEFVLGNPPYPIVVFRTDTDYHLISMPLSIGYRLIPATRLQWYLGGTFELNYTTETGRQTTFSEKGINTVTDKATLGSVLDLGYGVQTTLRYAITSQVAMQLEPAVRYNPRDGYLIRYYNAYQFRGAFAVLFKL